jgi:hypothetical protein
MNITLAELLILGFAAWRITNLLVDDNEDGPYAMLPWLRNKLGVEYDEKGRRYGRNELGKALICPWCTSIWVGMMLGLTYLIFAPAAIVVSLPFSLSGMALFIRGVLYRP